MRLIRGPLGWVPSFSGILSTALPPVRRNRSDAGGRRSREERDNHCVVLPEHGMNHMLCQPDETCCPKWKEL
jgi:hypothetical protein